MSEHDEKLVRLLWRRVELAREDIRAVHGFALDDLTHVGMASVMKGRAIAATTDLAYHAELVALMVERGGDTLDAYCWAIKEAERRHGSHPRSDHQGPA